MRNVLIALALSASFSATAAAQTPVAAVPAISGTRLEVSATGEVTRVPDVAVISAGVVTRAPTATAAIQENAARMQRVRAALRRAGIAERDIQTASINLNPEYRYQENQPPQLVGYSASNTLSVRFHDIAETGRILDALVAEGANQINGPMLTIEKPEQALDEARLKALANGRARAALYAQALGKRVVRLVSISETGGYSAPPPMPYAAMRAEAASAADTKIAPGEQKLEVTLNMMFELQ